MPARSIYFTDDDTKSYTPDTFVAEYNKHPDLQTAEEEMGINAKRLSVIATRLRSRGHGARSHATLRNR